MVKLGFIVEGATEKIILEHSDFFNYLENKQIDYVPEVIDAEGNGNLLPHKIQPLTRVLTDKGATHIFILTDLDANQCITNTKARIGQLPDQMVTVSVKAIEAWFLSDTIAMQSYFGDPSFSYEYPETPDNTFEEIKSIRKTIAGKGFTDKKVLANSMVRKHSFSILKAAQHPHCNSAKYFLERIAQLSGSN